MVLELRNHKEERPFQQKNDADLGSSASGRRTREGRGTEEYSSFLATGRNSENEMKPLFIPTRESEIMRQTRSASRLITAVSETGANANTNKESLSADLRV